MNLSPSVLLFKRNETAGVAPYAVSFMYFFLFFKHNIVNIVLFEQNIVGFRKKGKKKPQPSLVLSPPLL